MRRILATWIILTIGTTALAQNSMNTDSFEAITVRKAKEVELDIKTSQITRIEGPVDLTFEAKEKVNNLDLKADTIQVRYTNANDKAPSFIHMEDNLDINIQGYNILSEKADIDLDKGLATFTGKTIVAMPDTDPITTQGMTLNMNTNKLLLISPNIPRLSLNDTKP